AVVAEILEKVEGVLDQARYAAVIGGCADDKAVRRAHGFEEFQLLRRAVGHFRSVVGQGRKLGAAEHPRAPAARLDLRQDAADDALARRSRPRGAADPDDQWFSG